MDTAYAKTTYVFLVALFAYGLGDRIADFNGSTRAWVAAIVLLVGLGLAAFCLLRDIWSKEVSPP